MLTTIEDSIRVDPSQLGSPVPLAIEERVKELYFDKVLNNAGLVCSLYDILSIEGGDVHSGDGGARFRVRFRLVLFRPFEGEVLLGTILRSTEYEF
jgi:DNA-directed RNA polymerase subunit E'/Rpb7